LTSSLTHIRKCKHSDCQYPVVLPSSINSKSKEFFKDAGLLIDPFEYCGHHYFSQKLTTTTYREATTSDDQTSDKTSYEKVVDEDKVKFDKLKEFLAKYPQRVCFVDLDNELIGANFSGLNICNSIFLNCNLNVSSFFECVLIGSIFIGSSLNNSNFSHATLNRSLFLNTSSNYSTFKASAIREALLGVTILDQRSTLTAGQYTDSKNMVLVFHLKEIIKKYLVNLHLSGDSVGHSQSDKQDIENTILQINSEINEDERFFSDSKDKVKEFWLLCEEIFQSLIDKSIFSFTPFEATESIFESADLTNAFADNCKLDGTSFDVSRLQGASFEFCDLHACSFSRVSLGNTNFHNADLRYINLSSAFQEDGFTNFSFSKLECADITKCQFKEVSFENIQSAQRINFNFTTFGKNTKFSGDFSSSIFSYCSFDENCKIGFTDEEIRTKIKDADFSHCQFDKISIYSSDLDSSDFNKARFMNHCSISIAQNYKKENSVAKIHAYNFNEIKNNPATVSFKGATVGENGRVDLLNINFIACDFSDASVYLGKVIDCSFSSCNFDNSFIKNLSKLNNIDNFDFYACTFKNAQLHFYHEIGDKRINFTSCAFNSTNLIASYDLIDFFKCTFESTPLDRIKTYSSYDEYGPKNIHMLVLRRCRFLDGQYLGYLDYPTIDTNYNIRDILSRIIETTIGYSKKLQQAEKTSEAHNEKEMKSERQFMWNMFAENFRRLALPDEESYCLMRYKDVYLYSGNDNKDNTTIFPWLGVAVHCSLLLFVSCFFGAFVTAALNNFISIDLGWKFFICIFSMILFAVIWMYFIDWKDFKEGNSDKDDRPKIKYIMSDKWKIRWSKAIYHYGESPVYAIISWVFVILIFGIIYFTSGQLAYLDVDNDKYIPNIFKGQFDIHINEYDSSLFQNHNIGIFANCIYFSIVTFTTLGLGDMHPLHLTKLFAAIEACIGAVMMALFVLSFARRTSAR